MGNKCCKSNQSSTYSSANVTIRSFPSSYNSSIVRSGGSHAVTFGTSTRGNSLTDITMKSSDSDVGRDYRGGSSSTVGQENPIPIFLRRLNDLNIRVGTRTRFLIELDDPTGVQVRWFHNNVEAESERYQYIHEGGFYCLDIVPVTLDDEGLWVCTAQNYAGKSSTTARLSLTVPKAFKKPVFVEPLRAVLTQRGIVSLECKVVGVPTPKLRWYKDDKEIKAGDIFALTASASEDCLGVYTCEATNVMGTVTSVSKIQVMHASMDGKCDADSLVPYGPPPKFVKGLKDATGKVGSTLFLECQVEVPPWPRNVGWYNNNGVVNEGPLYHLMADGLGMYGVEIKSLRADHGSTWKCVATSSTGAKAVTSCLVTVSYPKNYRVPRFLESLRAIMTDEGLVSFECKVIGYPTPQLSWFKDGKQLQPGDVYELTGSKSLGSYCCVARNCMGETSSLAELTIEDIQNQLNESEKLQLTSNTQPPRFLLGLKSTEANINESFVFMIKVTTESTPPSISWYKEDEELIESNRYRFSTEEDGTYMLNIVPLEIDDQAEWKCVAVNKYGQTVTSSFLKLNVPKNFKSPRFLEELRIAFSNEGSVNLECKVIGVPQPQLKWFKDGQELNPGDMHKIISGQSGTCCLGTYTCQAHNCMGTVSSSATLLTMEDKSTVKSCASDEYLSVANQLVRNESLSTIPEERTSQMEKSYTIEEPADVSFSFDGKEVTVSLYETPDLTHDEALQIIEMYADELSEHISEDNVVDLPSLRIVKESSISGPVMMEALVIDVPVDFCPQQTVSDTEFDGVSLTEDTTLANNEDEDHSAANSMRDNSLEYFSDHLSSSGGGNSRRDVFFSASETTPKNGSSPHASAPRQRSGAEDGGDDDDDEHASFRTPKLFMSDSDDQMLTQLMLDGEKPEPPVVERPTRSESSNNCTEEEVSEAMLAESEPPPYGYFAAGGILARPDDEHGLRAAASDKVRGETPPGPDDDEDVFHDVDEFLSHVKVILESTVVKMHARQSFAESDVTPTELERSIQALHTLAWRFVDETERCRPAELDRQAASNASALMTAINAGLLALDQIDDPFGVSDNVLNEIQSAVCLDLETLNNRDLPAAEVLDLLSDQVRDFTAVVNRQVARVTEQRVVAVLRNTIGTTLVYVKTLQGSKVKCLSSSALTPLFSMIRPLETILDDLTAAEETASSSGHDDGASSGLKLKQMLIPPISTIAFCLDNLNSALKDEHGDEDDPDLRDIYNRINDAAEQFMTLASRGSETKNLAECFIAFSKPINDLCCYLRRLGRSTENIVSSDYGSDDKLLMDFETLFDELMMDIDTLINNVNVVRDSENNVNPLSSLLEPLQDMKIGLFQVNQVLLSNQTGSNMSYEVMSCFEHLSHQLVQLNSCIVNQSIVEETDKEIPFESSIKMMQNILFDDAIDDLGVNGILFGSVMKPLLQLQNLIVSKMASVESDLSFSEHTDVTGGDVADIQSLSLSLSNNAQTVLDKTGNDNLKRDNIEPSATEVIVTKEDDKLDDSLHASMSNIDDGSRVIEKNANNDAVASRGFECDVGAAFKDEEPYIITSENDHDSSGFEAMFDETDLETENDFVENESLDKNKISSPADDKSLDLRRSEQYIDTVVDKEKGVVIPEHIMELLDKSVQEDITLSSTTDLFDELQETLKMMTEATRDDTNDTSLIDDEKVQTEEKQDSSLKIIEELGGDISAVSDELSGDGETKESNYNELIKVNQSKFTETEIDNLYQEQAVVLNTDKEKLLDTNESDIYNLNNIKLEQTARVLDLDVGGTENIECLEFDKSTFNNTITQLNEISDSIEIKTEDIDDSTNLQNIEGKFTPLIVPEEGNVSQIDNKNKSSVHTPIENEISIMKDSTLDTSTLIDVVDSNSAIVTPLINQVNSLQSTELSNLSASEVTENTKDSIDVIAPQNCKSKEKQTNEVDDISIKNDIVENKTVYSSDETIDIKSDNLGSFDDDIKKCTLANVDDLGTSIPDTDKMSVKNTENLLVVKEVQETLYPQDETTVEVNDPVMNIEINNDDQIPQISDKCQFVAEINQKSVAYDVSGSETDPNKSLEDNEIVINETESVNVVIPTEMKHTLLGLEKIDDNELKVKNNYFTENNDEQIKEPKKLQETNLLSLSKDEIAETTLEKSNENNTMVTEKHNDSGDLITKDNGKSDGDLQYLPTSSQRTIEKTDSTKELNPEQSQNDLVLHNSEQIVDNNKQNSNDIINLLVNKEQLEYVEENSMSTPQSQITKLLDDESFVNNEMKTDEEFNVLCQKESKIESIAQITENQPLISSKTTVKEYISDDLKNIEEVSKISTNADDFSNSNLLDTKISTQIIESSKKELDAGNTVIEGDQSNPDIKEDILIKSELEMPGKLVPSLDSKINKTEADLSKETREIIEEKSTIEVIDEKEWVKEFEKSGDNLKQAPVLMAANENEITIGDNLCEFSPSIKNENIETAEVALSLSEPITTFISNEIIAAESAMFVDSQKSDENQIKVKYEENKDYVTYVEKPVLDDKDKITINSEHFETEEKPKNSVVEVICDADTQTTTGIDQKKKEYSKLTNESLEVKLNTALTCTEDTSSGDKQLMVETSADFENSEEKHDKRLHNVIEYEKTTVLDDSTDSKEKRVVKNVESESETHNSLLISENSVILDENKREHSLNEVDERFEMLAPKSLGIEPSLMNSVTPSSVEDLKATDINPENLDHEKKIKESEPSSEIEIKQVEDDTEKLISDHETTKTTKENLYSSDNAPSLDVNRSPNEEENVISLDGMKNAEKDDENLREEAVVVLEDVDTSGTFSLTNSTKSTVIELKQSKSIEENFEYSETDELTNSEDKPIKLECTVKIEECKAVVDEEVIVLDSTRPFNPNDVKVENVSEKLTESLAEKIEVIETNVSESLIDLNKKAKKPTCDNEINVKDITKIETDSSGLKAKQNKPKYSVDETALSILDNTEKRTTEHEMIKVDELKDGKDLSSLSINDSTTADVLNNQESVSNLSTKDESCSEFPAAPTTQNINENDVGNKATKDEITEDKDENNKMKNKSILISRKSSSSDISNNIDKSENKIDKKLEKRSEDQEKALKLETKLEQNIFANNQNTTDSIQNSASTDENNEHLVINEVNLNKTNTMNIQTIKDKEEECTLQKKQSPESKKSSSKDTSKNIGDSENKIDEKLINPSQDKENATKQETVMKKGISENETTIDEVQRSVSTDEKSENQKINETIDKKTKSGDEDTKIKKTPSPKTKKLSSKDVSKNIDDSQNDIDKNLKKPSEDKENDIKQETTLKKGISENETSIDEIQKSVSSDEKSENQKTNETVDKKTKSGDEDTKIKKTPSPKTKKLSSKDVSKNIDDSQNDIDKNLKKPSEDKENDIKQETTLKKGISENETLINNEVQKSVSTDEKSENQKTNETIDKKTKSGDEETKIKKTPSPKSKKLSSKDVSKNTDDSQNETDKKPKKPSEDKENDIQQETTVKKGISENQTSINNEVQKSVSTDEKSENQKTNETIDKKTKSGDEESKIKKTPSPKSKKLSSKDVSKNTDDSQNEIDKKLKKSSEDKENDIQQETTVKKGISENETSIDEIQKSISTDEKSENQKTNETIDKKTKSGDEETKIKKTPSPKSKKLSSKDVSKNTDDSQNEIDKKPKKPSEDKENDIQQETTVKKGISENETSINNEVQKSVSTDEKSENQKTNETVDKKTKSGDEESKIKKTPSPKSKKLSSKDVSKNTDDSQNEIDKKPKKPSEDKENDIQQETTVKKGISENETSINNEVQKSVSTDEKSENQKTNETVDKKTKSGDEETKIKKTPSPKSKKLSSKDVSKNTDDSQNEIDKKPKKPSEDKENDIQQETTVKKGISENETSINNEVQKSVSTDEKSENQKTNETVDKKTKSGDEETKIKKTPSPKSKKLSSKDVSKNTDDSQNEIDKKPKKPSEDKENDIQQETTVKKGISENETSIDEIQKSISSDEKSENQKTNETIDKKTKSGDEETKIKKTPSPKSKKLSSKDVSKNTDDSQNEIDKKPKKPSEDKENDIQQETTVKKGISENQTSINNEVQKSVSTDEKSENQKTNETVDKKTKSGDEESKIKKTPSPKSKKLSSKDISKNTQDSGCVIESNSNDIVDKVDEKPSHDIENATKVETKEEQKVFMDDKRTTDDIRKIESEENTKTDVDESKVTSCEADINEKNRGSKKTKATSQKSPLSNKVLETKKDEQEVKEKVTTKKNIVEDINIIAITESVENLTKELLGGDKSIENAVVDDRVINEKSMLREDVENALGKNKIEICEDDKNVSDDSETEPRGSVKPKSRRSRHKKSSSPESTIMKPELQTDARIDKTLVVDGSENSVIAKSSRVGVEKEIDKGKIWGDSVESKMSGKIRLKNLDGSKDQVDLLTVDDGQNHTTSTTPFTTTIVTERGRMREPVEKSSHDSLVKVRQVASRAGDVNNRALYKNETDNDLGRTNRDSWTTRESSSVTTVVPSVDRRFVSSYDGKRVDGGSSIFDRVVTTPLSRTYRSSPSIVVESSSDSRINRRDYDLGRSISNRYLSVTDVYASRSTTTTPRLIGSRSLTPEPARCVGSIAGRRWHSSEREISSGGRNYFGGSCRSLSSYCVPESMAYRHPSEISTRRYQPENENPSSSYWPYGSGVGGMRSRRGSDSFLHDPSARDGTYYSSWRIADRCRSVERRLLPYTDDLNQTKETFRRLYFCVRLIDQTVCSGTTIKFWCSVIGYPEPRVQWYRDGQKLNSYTYNASTRYRTRFTGGLAQLIIDDVQCCDSGEYTCVAVNSRDRITTTGYLTVYTSPSTFGAPSKASPSYAGVLRPQDRLYSWNSEDVRYRAIGFGSDYDWSADGRHPKYPKFVTGIIADDVVTSGGTIALQVRVRGSPAPNVTWMHDSKPLPRMSNKYIYLDEGGLYTLLVKDVTARDGGAYVCRACNLYGSADAEKTVRVTDHHWSPPSSEHRGAKPATIVSRPGDRLNVAVGEDITVTLRVTGEPKPKVIWMRGSRDVTFLDRSLKETVNDYVKLSIKKAQLSDAGTYFIVAKNVYGSDRAFVTVGVSDRIRISPVPQ